MKYSFDVKLENDTAVMLVKRDNGTTIKRVGIDTEKYYLLVDAGFVDLLIQYYYLHECSDDFMATLYFDKMCEQYKVVLSVSCSIAAGIGFYIGNKGDCNDAVDDTVKE